MWPASVFTVTKFNRFARNMAEANQILTDLSDREVLFGLAGSVYDWNDPFGSQRLTLARQIFGRDRLSTEISRARAVPAE